jgi:hypothetical protein
MAGSPEDFVSHSVKVKKGGEKYEEDMDALGVFCSFGRTDKCRYRTYGPLFYACYE